MLLSHVRRRFALCPSLRFREVDDDPKRQPLLPHGVAVGYVRQWFVVCPDHGPHSRRHLRPMRTPVHSVGLRGT